MDSDSRTRTSSSYSRRYQPRPDVYNGEECEREEELRPEYICPFCVDADEFDIIGLCIHIDEEHAVQSKNGVCPVCMKNVGLDLVCHLTTQHGTLLNVQRRRRSRKGGSNLSYSALRKELRDGNLQSLLGGGGSSTLISSSSNLKSDPLLTSFMYNPSEVDEPPIIQPLIEDSSLDKSSIEDLAKRMEQQSPPLSDEDFKEKTKRSEFVQGLILSTFLDDYL